MALIIEEGHINMLFLYNIVFNDGRRMIETWKEIMLKSARNE